MKKIEKTENQFIFSLDIDDVLINSIRRYLNQIPVLAINEVEIIKNDSSLYDETISHRLGLIPLKTDKSIKENFEGKLKLNVKSKGTVYSGDLKGNVEIVYKNMPIVVLSDGQEIELNAYVRIGNGVEHSKFSPGILFYRNVAEITIDQNLFGEIKDFLVGNEIKEKGNKVVIIDDKKRPIVDICEGIAQKKGKEIEVTNRNEKVITIESFGQMKPEDIFKRAIEFLKKDLLSLNKEVDKNISTY